MKGFTFVAKIDLPFCRRFRCLYRYGIVESTLFRK